MRVAILADETLAVPCDEEGVVKLLDANGNGMIFETEDETLADALVLLNYVFKGVQPPGFPALDPAGSQCRIVAGCDPNCAP